MIVLALDTAMAACSVAVLRQGDDTPLASAYVAMDKGHAEVLPNMVAEQMRRAGVSFADLSRIAVTTGPGTFTGLRIGLAFARGLGRALDLPVIGIDTLAAIAANLKEGRSRLVVADARKGEVYAALFGPNGAVLRQPAVVARDAAGEGAAPDTLVLGTGADSVPHLTKAMVGDLPNAAHFGRLAFDAPWEGEMPSPLYLRAADAKPQEGYSLRKRVQSTAEVRTEAAALLSRLHGEVFDEAWDAAAFRTLMDAPGSRAFVLSEGDEPAGFLLARAAADEAEIITIGTRPFAQRRGVAEALLAHAFKALREGGITQIFLEVAASNWAARGLYAKCGFTEAGLRKGYYQRGNSREDAIVLRKSPV